MILAPSILSADLAHLADELERVERGGAGLIHVDVMDGHFVPNLALGPSIVAAARRSSRLPIDVHLMIENAERYLAPFADAGADWISVHVEAQVHLERTIAAIKDRGLKAGAVLNPATPLQALDEILSELDYVLIMSVNPGYGGQRFLPGSLDKLRRLRGQVKERGLATQLEVDGGVDLHNVRQLVEAGADVLVAGTAVFGKGAAEAATRQLIEAAR